MITRLERSDVVRCGIGWETMSPGDGRWSHRKKVVYVYDGMDSADGRSFSNEDAPVFKNGVAHPLKGLSSGNRPDVYVRNVTSLTTLVFLGKAVLDLLSEQRRMTRRHPASLAVGIDVS